MQHLPEGKILDAWRGLSVWIDHLRPISRLVILTTSLVIFLAFLPSSIRIAFWNGLQSHKILAGLLLVFSLLAISLVWSTGQKIDAWVFLFFNLRGARPIWLDRIMSGYTQIGSAIAALGIALVLYLANNRLLAYDLILGTLTLWMVVEMVKFLIHRSRPFIRITQARIVGRQAIGQSFPSGHTSQTFFLATMMVQHFHTSVWASILLYTIALLVGITRMYVGAHYPRDVLAGAILGSAWGLLGVIAAG